VTPDLHYTDPRLARLYDQDCGWGMDNEFYFSLAGRAPQRILDLGCGTGILCNAYAAQGHVVTGLDPAAAMLEVARAKPHAPRITWVHATAQSFDSPHRFDLIVMTGHAFQVLLDDADIAATFAVMRNHLAPGGTIAFETRNPHIDWAHRWDGLIRDHLRDGQPVRQSHAVIDRSADRITFDTTYAFPDATLISTSTLRFPSHAAVTAMLYACGLQVGSVFGDWRRSTFNADMSEEMIFIAHGM
jgi:2-polyprenyl-3-methyl-5-hydroxy-6-metoxy-1,4-benzoquinol methylase